jgi:hypothetical protein
LDAKLREKYCKNKAISNYYDELLVISKELADYPKSIYKDSPALCMYAALILSSKTNVVYFQLSTGRGKSWVNILLGLYYKKH